MRLVLASNNAKKLKELQALFEPIGVELVNQGALGIAEAEEPHHTFIENALAKARAAARASGGPALADDSGLCVAALGGAPGVVSAHFAPLQLPPTEREQARAIQDAANNALLLQRLGTTQDRRAHFISVLVALRSAEDPEPLVATGRWQGLILSRAEGTGGFGYDPLMYIPALKATVAALPAEVKNSHSHRALAAEQMRAMMQATWFA